MKAGSLLELAAATALLGLVVVDGAAGQIAIPPGYEVGSHIVRPGDTLRDITQFYLGSQDLWEKNWRLNPHIADPDLLYPLQRLVVLVQPRVARPAARLTTISGDVEGRPVPSDWLPAEEDDLMIERDGVRAGDDSSTVMQFLDGSELTVKDDSTVFLRVAGRSLRGYERRSVEIVRGEADLAATRLDDETQIELVIGSAVAMPRGAEAGSLETRARKVESGGSHVMMFEGISEVVAAGETVTLSTGTGTAVPVDGPPAPPETLLEAASGLQPEDGAVLELGRDRFSWSAVDGASSYTVEVCRDRRCGALVTRRTGLLEPAMDGATLPEGDFFWRVTAVSATGLDGFATESLAVRAMAMRPDSEPPSGAFVVSGRFGEADGVRYYGAEMTVRLEVADEISGVELVTLMLDGREVPPERLLGPWSTGDFVVTATVTDRAGNRASFGPLELHVDADAPVVEASVAGSELAGDEARRKWERESRKWAKRELRGVGRLGWSPRVKVVEWSSSGSGRPKDFVPDLRRPDSVAQEVEIERRGAEWLIFAPALEVGSGGEPLSERVLLLAVRDERSQLAHCRLRRRAGPEGWYWLELEAADVAGNRVERRWQFVRSR